ncbi:DUF3658 domain-containing protein [Echinicola sp. 20G]|uniref:DUF3658 domain-containing protein n=1 Tax=Echinicola sp. 20G TaxID=2781961 RepID=UPI001910E684|nr:DUF3658 domain-containing protein [Echinicola sp. 20G]
MQKENIHIVFGQLGKRTLMDSKAIDLSNSQVISLEDKLNIGPSCDIDVNEDISKRKNWFLKIHGAHPNSLIENDLISLKSMLKNVENINKVFIWTGYYASERISTARLINHLFPFDKPILVANFNTPVKSIHGAAIYPKSLEETASFQVKELFEQFEPIEKGNLKNYLTIWDKVKSGNGELWICDNSGQPKMEKTDYFDSCLLSHCKENFQPAARIIGETLVDIDFEVGDDYLNWRLKKLSIDGKIASKGKLIDIRDYEVKKNTYVNTLNPA